MKIDFCIVGAQKSGSSTLSEALAQAEDVWMPKMEQAIFEDPYYQNGAVSDFISEGVKRKEKRVVGIKRPDYLCKKGVAERLYEHNENMKIIIILRDPVSRFMSAAYWYMQVGLVPVMELNDLIYKVFYDESFLASYPKSKELLEYGRFYSAVLSYRSVFPSENIFLTSNDELKSDIDGVLVRLSHFLNVRVNKSCRIENKKVSVYSRARLRYLSYINRRLFFVGRVGEGGYYYDVRGGVSRLFFYFFKAIDRFLLSRFFDNSRSVIDKKSKELLRSYYKEDLVFLESVGDCNE